MGGRAVGTSATMSSWNHAFALLFRLGADPLAGPVRDGMAIHSWNVIGTGPDSARVVLRLWGHSELEVRAAAFRAAASLCDAGWASYVDYSTSRDGLSADVVYELVDGSERRQRDAVAAVMYDFGRGPSRTYGDGWGHELMPPPPRVGSRGRAHVSA